MPDAREVARLQAVEKAVQDELAEPGAITKAELRAALATPAPVLPEVTDLVEETV